jgi:hypothetical protein
MAPGIGPGREMRTMREDTGNTHDKARSPRPHCHPEADQCGTRRRGTSICLRERTFYSCLPEVVTWPLTSACVVAVSVDSAGWPSSDASVASLASAVALA